MSRGNLVESQLIITLPPIELSFVGCFIYLFFPRIAWRLRPSLTGVKKDIGIPALFPFKDQLLAEQEQAKLQVAPLSLCLESI